jgi:hypothetical protein
MVSDLLPKPAEVVLYVNFFLLCSCRIGWQEAALLHGCIVNALCVCMACSAALDVLFLSGLAGCFPGSHV